MTSVAMVTGKTPAEQNEALKADNGFTKNAWVKWDKAGKSMGKVFNDKPLPANTSTSIIMDAICKTQVVIAKVKSVTPGKNHFVVVTGEKWDLATQKCRITIADPGTASKVYLDEYEVIKFYLFGEKEESNETH